MRTTARRHVERGAFAPEEQGQREGPEMEQDHNRYKKKKKLLKEEGFAGKSEQGRGTGERIAASSLWLT